MFARRISRGAVGTGKRRRWQPGVEALEGRQLLALATVAVTLDPTGTPIDFAIQPDGTVAVNLARATNDVVLTRRLSGYQPLSGLSARSIAAFTDAGGVPAVVAMTATQSSLSVNRYERTGDPANPRAWTGWTSLGDFVATSVVAASNGESGAAVFAIGADGQVYENAYTPSGPLTTSAFSGFQKLLDTTAAAISVVPDGPSAYQVVALGGAESYVAGTRATISGGTITASPWSQYGGFVARSINVTPGLNVTPTGTYLGDRHFLFVTGTDERLYQSTLTADLSSPTKARTASEFKAVGDPTQITGAVLASAAFVADGSMSIVAVTVEGLTYNTVVVASATGAGTNLNSIQNWISTNNRRSYITTPLRFVASRVVALATPGGTGIYLASSVGGSTYLQTFPRYRLLDNSGSVLSQDFNYGDAWVDLATQSNHPLAVAVGPTGLPVVVTLGSDGAVFAKRALTAGENGAPDTYGDFEPLAGITATSITATRSPNGVALFALTGDQSFIYSNEYRPTGDPDIPHAWTGWLPLGTFVARNIQAVTVGANGPLLFALGANETIYRSQATTPATGTARSDFSPFAAIDGLVVGSFSARVVGEQVLLAALTGPASYAYANLISFATGTPIPAVISTWTNTGTYVMNRVVATVDPTGAPVVAGVSPNGSPAISLSLQGPPFDSNFIYNYNYLNFPVYQFTAFQNSPLGGTAALAPLPLPNGAGVAYLDLHFGQRDLANAVFLAFTLPGQTWPTQPAETPVGDRGDLRSLAVAPEGLPLSFYVVDTQNRLYLSRATAETILARPYSFNDFVALGTLPS